MGLQKVFKPAFGSGSKLYRKAFDILSYVSAAIAAIYPAADRR